MIVSPKVLFIGLDAASRDLVLDWCEQGLLPNLRSLQQQGSWGLTVNAPAVYTGSLWPSVWSGTGPGSHGCYYNEQLQPGTYKVAEFLGDSVKREPFWNVLSRAGHRIGLFDVPKAPVSHGLNGIHVVDWGTHDADFSACSWPPQLIDEIHARHGTPPFRRCDWMIEHPGGERELRGHLLRSIEMKVAITEDLLRREPWDLFMVTFGESHCVGHQLWHLHDASHPKHNPALAKELGDPVREVYLALDRAVGRLLEYAGPQTTVVLLCSHGMSAHYDATYLLDEILRRLDGRSTPVARSVLDWARRNWKKLPLSFTERFTPFARAVNRLPDSADRRHRPSFVVPTNANSAGIRLNLAGREPAGILQPGQEAEEYVVQLIADLHELVEPASGRPLVKEVLHSADVFPGEHASLLPDLFVRWHRDTPITGASSPKIGTIVEEDTSTRRTGDHRAGGLFLLRGPDIDAGVQLTPAADEDFAPSIAALLGIELPDVDGRPLCGSATIPRQIRRLV
jgi:predicted AlkP superfamily phosphohydrolase/phosphomutase